MQIDLYNGHKMVIVCFCKLVVLGLVFSIPSQEIGWKECVRNNLFCVKWDMKTCGISVSISCLGLCCIVSL